MVTKQNLKAAPKKAAQRVDEATAEIVTGINHLLLNAQKEGLTTITTILKDARESIAWWAAQDNYSESNVERIYHNLTSHSGLHTALDLLAKFSAIKDSAIKEELLQAIGQFQLKSPLPLKAKLKA